MILFCKPSSYEGITMEAFIEFGRGPFFRFAVAVAIFGLLRHLILTIIGLRRVRAMAGDKSFSPGRIFIQTLSRLNPLRYFFGNRAVYSILSAVFHVGLILVPIFYLGHIRLWRQGIGLSWPALPGSIADILTLITIVTAGLLLVGRALARTSRLMSRPQDWLLPPLILVAFLTGYFLAHPTKNPLSLETAMVLHVWVANLLLLLTPFTKIAHCALLPLSQFVAEMSWRMVPGAGHDVDKTLGKEGKPI